ncbi:hypothetical protein PVA45_08460 (plasmid) [Entomospira entomophila]|uniref:Uncharacterized protein n=1 Tax=Entomospira entomophila TaxID=2719988 RepID=A0A968GFJ0_9SPIO|nr:hypothetical protein [Entomospira entomophilus]NIZ41509.1 hypothetical protein [Entomospira entomophilus]WDI36407.1 hypothetical protein PVA45_08460 [Entomospira entomophilus]
MSELLSEDQVESIYREICESLYLDLAEVEFDLTRANEEERAKMEEMIAKIRRYIATERLTLEDGKVCYRLIKPVKHLQEELQHFSFTVDSLAVEKVLKAQSSKQQTESSRAIQMLSLIFQVSPLSIERLHSKDFANLSELVGFFITA